MTNPKGRSPPAASLLDAVATGIVAALLTRYPHSLAPERAAVPVHQATRREAGASSGDVDGRTAETPSHFGYRSWKSILKRVYSEIGDDRLLAVAASVTFYGLLAIFPAIAALVSLYGLFANPGTIASQVNSLSGIVPNGAMDVIGEQVKRISSKPAGSLGFGFVTGLAVALWSANAGVKAIFDALNVVYDEKEKRGFFKLNAISLLFTVGSLAVVLVALGAVIVVPIILNLVGLGAVVETLISLARWPILSVLIVGALTILYRFGPSRRQAKWRWVTWGSGAAAVSWLIVSMLFSWYVTKFGTYNETYGSLGAAIGFMTWMWLSSIVVLVGAELNAEMEHQTERDTTVAGGKPLGTRGATMADTVAP